MENKNAVLEETQKTIVPRVNKRGLSLQAAPIEYHASGMELETVTIQSKPYVGQYQGIGRQGLDFWGAVSELIDNTLTVTGKTLCTITLDRKNGTLTISDNSIGIKGVDLQDVISLGKKVNQGKQLLSYSGVGMKAALYFLGNHFDIFTKPESEDVLYKLTPNFNTKTDPSEKLADFSVTKMSPILEDGTMMPAGTKIIIRDLVEYPKNSQSEDVTIQMLRATYADYLESGKLTLRFMFIPESKKGKIATYNLTPLRPLLSNDLRVIDKKLLVGANEPRKSDTLNSNPTDTHLDWEVKIEAGWKLHPKVAMEYYISSQPNLVYDNYGIRGGTKCNSPYDWTAETGGVNFKTSGIGNSTDGKILMFNQFGASSRKEGLWVGVTLVRGIEPTMIKNAIRKDANYNDMEKSVIKWLTENGFRSRVKTGMLHLGEADHVRDKFVDHLRTDVLLRQSWGIDLDRFDQQVITENELSGGRVDVGVMGDCKTVAIECKKEVITGQDVSQGAGYALDMGADLLVLVAQKITATGAHMMTLWKDKLGIDIVFYNIADLYTISGQDVKS